MNSEVKHSANELGILFSKIHFREHVFQAFFRMDNSFNDDYRLYNQKYVIQRDRRDILLRQRINCKYYGP